MAELITLPTFTDERGKLTVLEKYLPFTVKRAYWIYDVNEKSRGGHRHLVTSQAFICLKGHVEVNIKNQGQQSSFKLKDPSQCLLVPPEDWHTLDNFSYDAILLVLASHEYSPDDYSSEPL